tara:strand:+ start:155 stop:394 length:240 start_codon:yes stop_codon:yes gene_type:complete
MTNENLTFKNFKLTNNDDVYIFGELYVDTENGAEYKYDMYKLLSDDTLERIQNELVSYHNQKIEKSSNFVKGFINEVIK